MGVCCMLTRRWGVRVSLVSALIAVATFGIPGPVSAAETERRQCLGYGGLLIGYITKHTGVTIREGNCGPGNEKIKVRVRYAHMGGVTWSKWKITTDDTVMKDVYPSKAIYAEHFSPATGTFITQFE